MRKKKLTFVIGVCFCLILLVAAVVLLSPKEEEDGEGKGSQMVRFEQVKEEFLEEIKELKEGKYENLIAKEFTASMEDAEGLYRFQILRNQDLETTMENVDEMMEALESFFGDDLDKAKLYHMVYDVDENGEIPSDAIGTEISYDEVMDLLKKEETGYSLRSGFVLGGDMYAHIDPGFSNTWFSKRSLGTSLPGGDVDTREYLYVTGIRQSDAVVKLKDKTYKLEELEHKVLDYVNGKAFPLPHHKELSYQIGTSHVITTEEKECINFILRRVYKGVPLEYGSQSASGGYVDELVHDYTTVNYVEGTQPDTMMGFIGLKSKVEVIEEVTELLTAGEAISLLSEKLGKNSIYEVYGVELVYRNCEVPEEKTMEIQEILEPKWKIITVNKNDDKYTIFYVDVETGEITDRFEYYYD